ncbi:ISLre2 family transposase [Schleiferilactobacillus harbinensis]|uniref:ISLre2 family transposase n=1 Tax=Schleiferilactobacillus harbinensis TaxID=304207 RepID=UPI001AAFD53E|nr:ISLre2 family transposase [Schleiferilactobacillus harbinensis]MBO3093156.1 ISLre2 family transposase [Schleiferilactobacillus harbinensis]
MSSMVQQIITEMVTAFGKSALSLLEGEQDFAHLVCETQVNMNKSLCQLLGWTLEEADRNITASQFRQQRYSIKAIRERRLDTRAGTVEFKRHYFEDKQTGEKVFLLDEFVGIEKGARLSLDLKASLLEDAAMMSYRQAAKHNGGQATQSASTVMHVVHKQGKVITALDQLDPATRPVPPVLFVEADEDHVPHQDGTNHFLKIVYVHEGYSHLGHHKFGLKHPFYITGEYPGPEGTDEMWRTVMDCIERQYNGLPKRFFLAGDGAGWIKTGANFLPNCTLVYDKFHLKKVCKQASVGVAGNLGETLMHWALAGHSSFLEDYFKVRLADPQLRAGEERSLRQARTLIRGNWKQIKANNDSDFHGCSAEGHVSHILSERFSSRPMGWSQAGTDSLSQTRVFVMKDGKVLEKLEANAKRIGKAKLALRIDTRIKRRFSDQTAKYAAVAAAEFVQQASGRRRSWQHGITHDWAL